MMCEICGKWKATANRNGYNVCEDCLEKWLSKGVGGKGIDMLKHKHRQERNESFFGNFINDLFARGIEHEVNKNKKNNDNDGDFLGNLFK